MRILHVVHQYLPEHVGGTELYTQSLALRQLALGHSVAIFAPASNESPWPDPIVDSNLRIYKPRIASRSPSSVFRSTFGHAQISRYFREILNKEKPELVHIQHLMGLPAGLVDRITSSGIPYVVTLHDYWFVCANAQLLTNYDDTICAGPNWWFNCARCALARINRSNVNFVAPAIMPIMASRDKIISRVLEGAAKLIAPTNFVRKIYSDLGVPSQNIQVIGHGIDLPIKPITNRQPRSGELHILYIGGLSWQKGVHILIEAVNQMPVEGTRLTIYGDMKAFPDYIAELQTKAEHPGILFGGRLSRRDFWPVLGDADVVVVPSLWYETASLIIQEAFAAHVPVIASDIGALKERVVNEVDGLLVMPGNIEELKLKLNELRKNSNRILNLRSGIKPVRTMAMHVQDIEKAYRNISNGL